MESTHISISYGRGQKLLQKPSKLFSKVYTTRIEKINKKSKTTVLYITILKRHDLFKDRVCVGHTEYIKQRSKGTENRREDLST